MSFAALIGAFIQGGAIGRLVKMFGEPKLISLSLFLTGISLILLPFIKGDGQLKWLAVLHATDWPWIKMLLALALLAVGSALTRPPLFGLLSNLAPANEQGATIGVAQSAGAWRAFSVRCSPRRFTCASRRCLTFFAAGWPWWPPC